MRQDSREELHGPAPPHLSEPEPEPEPEVLEGWAELPDALGSRPRTPVSVPNGVGALTNACLDLATPMSLFCCC